MAKSKKQKALDEELLRECEGYDEDDDKPDGAYIKEYGFFFNINKIKRLIDSGADVDAKADRYGNTPLWYAVQKHNIDLVKLLIDSGADVNVKLWDGYTPLHQAVRYDNIALAKLLIEAGADVNAKDSDGNTPLAKMVHDYNSMYRKSFDIELANALIEAGAKF